MIVLTNAGKIVDSITTSGSFTVCVCVSTHDNIF